MKTLAASLLLATLGTALPAHAAQDPVASARDSRMRYIPYVPDQVVHLSTAVGATFVVGFGPSEAVRNVAVTDSLHLKALPAGNFLFFKPSAKVALQPVIVLTQTATGALRRYVFEFETVDAADLAANEAGVYYSVQFTYPGDVAAARRAAAAAQAKKDEAEQQAREAQFQMNQAHDEMERQKKDPYFGTHNWHYVAQGDRTVLPLEVWDNGNVTSFRFPGNVRIPAVFTLNPDGKEATANYSVTNDARGMGTLVVADHVARGWRLRDGNTVLCIWNQSYNPVGLNPGTNTTSPNVVRVTKGADQ
ncbi:type IV secretion system protein VirB9 [Endobacter medicaginis]|uniref:TrbG/VirB9 family P-type conjugative transfer protein n=1 Tax=Endobacter medicaginis TaxID=1181271 RepID=A0A839V379_9PROT|nr:TrbG/VirB9 family P-type conjugative transfer protein [Endobacter medicaginis]MBB3175233.1 type IV secretion system protein VirB9 [Endobacter medicaginis]MCX5476283.1 TrbG/VirB9 family P-type conjugative transfer protein [Endobacter medicaginis]NVN28959.1 TrbG/VirB9 family P-type conjugative transfer protein [Endobacter medicaginis]